MSNNNRNRNITLTVIITVVFLVGMMGFWLSHRHSQATKAGAALANKIDGTILPSPQPVKPFHLTSIDNTPFTEKNLRGHWSLLFFGFTNCPYVCPTTLSETEKMYEALEKKIPKSLLPQVVLISVDPQRDTIKRIKHYVKQFNPNFYGARGSAAELDNLANQMHVTYSKISADDHNDKHYTMTHSAQMLVIDPQGRLRALLSYPHEAKQMTHDYQVIVTSQR